MTCGVYEFWCGPYFYHGSSKNMEGRLKGHLKNLRKGKHCNPKVQAAFNKYGMQDERFLVVCAENLRIQYEQDYIDANWDDPHYLNLGRYARGGGAMLGKKGSDKQKARCKEVHTGKVLSEETKALISASKSGVKQSAEHTAKSAAARRGMKQTDEHKTKVADAHRGSKRSAEARARMSAAQQARFAKERAAKAVTVAALDFD